MGKSINIDTNVSVHSNFVVLTAIAAIDYSCYMTTFCLIFKDDEK